MENKKYLHLSAFVMLIGILLFFQLGEYTVDAESVKESIISVNILEWTPMIWGIVIIAGSIGITLSYVSWRKYKGEQNTKKNRDKMID